MRIGTRLTAGLLLALTPLVAGFTYWHIQRTTQAYVTTLEREIRATSNGLTPALTADLRATGADRVAAIRRDIAIEGSTSAVFAPDGGLQYSSPDFSPQLMPNEDEFAQARLSGAAEFDRWTADGHWVGRLAVLPRYGGNDQGYLLVAQDWTNLNDDLRERTMAPAMAGFLAILAIVTVVPIMVRRYVSGPLAELSQKVMGFSEDADQPIWRGDELLMLTEEFRRLDHQVTVARNDLVAKHQRELELERKLERAGKLATIGTLASGLAHEIGTPLGVIRGRAEFLLGSRPTPAKTEDGLRIIVNQIDRISRIVRMLLDYAREYPSQRMACDVRVLAESALKLMEMETARRGIHVVAELGDEPLMIDCDPHQIQQVLINLIVNALDAMDSRNDGILRIAIFRHEMNNTAHAALICEDNGPGIPASHQPRIFDPFFSTKEPGKGTGMGLAVTQSIVRDHLGDVTFDSVAPGARFVVTIPLAVKQTKVDSTFREERVA
ncbi:MAG TPA: ATP-binding protein [Candidatus Binataceae bacterium]|nr:ATP-binding protein [Candidatus Binataceae bacterium]